MHHKLEFKDGENPEKLFLSMDDRERKRSQTEDNDLIEKEQDDIETGHSPIFASLLQTDGDEEEKIDGKVVVRKGNVKKLDAFKGNEI